MKLKLQISRAASLSGVFMGVVACLILTTTFFSFLERDAGVWAMIGVGMMGAAALVTTGYLIYVVRRSAD